MASHELPTMRHCPENEGWDCITVGYSILGDPARAQEYIWIDEIMEEVAAENALQFEKDVKKLSVGPLSLFYNYLHENTNKVQYSVVWCVDTFDVTREMREDQESSVWRRYNTTGDDEVTGSIPCKFGG